MSEEQLREAERLYPDPSTSGVDKTVRELVAEVRRLRQLEEFARDYKVYDCEKPLCMRKMRDLESKLATAVESLRWIHSLSNME